eukprot:CAMPEP_0169102040 /NCGR_PEP_ID=MMETSP1015-20121227/21956_1 /TAXON_ID=342587 /ORGANISM="Karlodinium micrum, Strain CCMP2283" /LENGTH=1112 /DNA_ID=CAMNT_0009163117 /DNA_START=28 /DNA_END=3366 /DNA_ORIENTATION=+
MTSNFNQKPESALKKADALIDVGKKQAALETLHEAIQNKKWKHNWSVVVEQIMLRHLELCVELKKMHIARDGLHQYRTACQAANIASFEKVVQQFRMAAEGKVEEAKRSGEADKVEIDDLEEQESPEKIMLRAIQEGTRQQNEERDVVAHFQFLWATYKAIMDVLKSHSRLEEVYHETVRKAFEFCRANDRPRDFKNLCGIVQKNYQDLFKQKSNAQNPVNPNSHETIEHTITTRFSQLRTAAELGLWREAYNTASEVYELMNKVQKVKIRHRSEYYDYLAKIFWKSEDYLFHAFACLKNVLFLKTAKKDLAPTELQALASKAVMAMLCVPFQKRHDSVQATLALTVEDSYQKAKKHATLCSAQAVPTREAIIQQLTEKSLTLHAAAPVKKLFELIESDFTPLSLCQDAKPFLEEISGMDHLSEYVIPVKRIIFLRLVKQLSEVYANMTIENFERAASIVPFSTGEKWMANAARQQGINIQINYREKAIVFGATRKVDMKSMRQPLIEIGHKLQQAMQRVAPEDQQKKERFEKAGLVKTIQERMNRERSENRKRKEVIEQRKEESEKRKEKQMREEMEQQRKEAAKEEEKERKRLEEERKQREIERQNKKKEDEKLEKIRAKINQMQSTGAAHLKIGNKKVTQFNEDDLKKVDVVEIDAAFHQTENRQRQEKIRARKLEGKRVDHLARAFREQELDRLTDWQDEVADVDNQFLDEAQDRDAKAQKEKHELNIQEKNALLAFQEQKDAWVSEQLESRYEDHRKHVDAQKEKNEANAIEGKIKRAKERKAEAVKRERQEEERKRREKEEEEKRKKEERRREEERRRQQQEEEEEAERQKEEEERKRKQKEEKEAKAKEMREMADKAAEKQRAKEREIEERLRNGGGGGEDRAARAGADRWGDDRPSRPAGGDRWGDDRRGGGDDRRGGGDDWRRGGDDRKTDDRDRNRDRDRDSKWSSSKDDGDNWRRSSDDRRGGDDVRRTMSKKDSPADEGGWRREAPPADEEKKPRPGLRDDRVGTVPERSRKPWDNDGTKGNGRADDSREIKREAPAEDKKKQREPEPQAEEEAVEDDGFETVVKGKKKPPWKRETTTSDEKGGSAAATTGTKSTPPWKK